MAERGWVEQVRAAHPWRWRWLVFKECIQFVKDWVRDRPYWHHVETDEGPDLELRTLRTKRLIRDTVEESAEILRGLE